ncbi:MAG TPA: hypothetical protein VFI31_29330 [Pirellulales bacterium]|nr:hypothetical protein [Pirellulales bacterium]
MRQTIVCYDGVGGVLAPHILDQLKRLESVVSCVFVNDYDSVRWLPGESDSMLVLADNSGNHIFRFTLKHLMLELQEFSELLSRFVNGKKPT